MRNKILKSLNSDSDFSLFINSRFKNPIDKMDYPSEYEKRRPPKSLIEDTSNPEVRKIIERELIRDNIYSKYNFDIYEFPFVVFYENGISKEILKPFKRLDKARDYSNKLLNQDTFSLLISIMNHDIECQLFSKQ
ncbi:hypothetical protein [uncultured Sunxiuqinia sp.]|uniref:hypothetical protein n=1 Tax=uncultured Sunxiuqinia sp. TaxID=1573825 RepID=UPI002AA7F9FC|nr:hypothetical protein [uncultured Sunxiuqinia sp.]